MRLFAFVFFALALTSSLLRDGSDVFVVAAISKRDKIRQSRQRRTGAAEDVDDYVDDAIYNDAVDGDADDGEGGVVKVHATERARLARAADRKKKLDSFKRWGTDNFGMRMSSKIDLGDFGDAGFGFRATQPMTGEKEPVFEVGRKMVLKGIKLNRCLQSTDMRALLAKYEQHAVDGTPVDIGVIRREWAKKTSQLDERLLRFVAKTVDNSPSYDVDTEVSDALDSEQITAEQALRLDDESFDNDFRHFDVAPTAADRDNDEQLTYLDRRVFGCFSNMVHTRLVRAIVHKEQSFWGSYIDIMPAPEELEQNISYWGDEERAEIYKSRTDIQANYEGFVMKEDTLKRFRVLCTVLGPVSSQAVRDVICNHDAYARTFMLVMTRAWDLNDNWHFLIPFADMMNHQQTALALLQTDWHHQIKGRVYWENDVPRAVGDEIFGNYARAGGIIASKQLETLFFLCDAFSLFVFLCAQHLRIKQIINCASANFFTRQWPSTMDLCPLMTSYTCRVRFRRIL
jgi:hypothetical protein